MSSILRASKRSKADLKNTILQARVWNSLAFADIRSKYRLSTFGSLWITLTTGALALAIGLIYGQFFGQDVTSYLPYFTASYITWMFIASVVSESATTFISSGNLIKSSQMPIAFYVLRMLQRNLIIVAHNAIVLLAIWPFVRWHVGPEAILSLLGLALLYFFLAGASLVIAIACVRYRDIPPLIQVFTQFLFFASPVIWYPEQIKFGKFVLEFNPIAHFLAVVRDPILGRPIHAEDWMFATGFAALSLAAGSLMYLRFRDRVAYWV
jgi:ABC-type polysaccharide/polyol phosphate export permease